MFFDNYTQIMLGQIQFAEFHQAVDGELCDQATKCKRWMPRCQEAMKDVVSCDKPREAAIRR